MGVALRRPLPEFRRAQGSSWAEVCNVSPLEPRGAKVRSDGEAEGRLFLSEPIAPQMLCPLPLSCRKRLPSAIYHRSCQRSPALPMQAHMLAASCSVHNRTWAPHFNIKEEQMHASALTRSRYQQNLPQY